MQQLKMARDSEGVIRAAYHTSRANPRRRARRTAAASLWALGILLAAALVAKVLGWVS